MKAEYIPNRCLQVTKTTNQHNEIKSKIQLTKKTNILHLSNLNLDFIFPEVFKLVNLIRLDLSFNSLVQVSPLIGNLINLRTLWLNDNPLRELPIELCNCKKLAELDLKNTFIITLPRELAELAHLTFLNLQNCPLKDSLVNAYQTGMVTIHKSLRSKEDRRIYKQKLMNKLCEWVYPSVDKYMIGDIVENVFGLLKGYDSAVLKKLYRDCQTIFPLKFEQVDPNAIKEKLLKVFDETKEREEVSKIQLEIKAHFINVSLAELVKLSTDIYRKGYRDKLKVFLKFKEQVFAGNFGELTADKLQQNLEAYKKARIEERANAIKKLNIKIGNLYSDEKLDAEVITKYAQDIIAQLKKTEKIVNFLKHYKEFMPKPHELKYFDAVKIAAAFNSKYGT